MAMDGVEWIYKDVRDTNYETITESVDIYNDQEIPI